MAGMGFQHTADGGCQLLALGMRDLSVTLYKLMSAVGFREEGSITLYRLMSAVVFWLPRNGISSVLHSFTSPLLLGPFI